MQLKVTSFVAKSDFAYLTVHVPSPSPDGLSRGSRYITLFVANLRPEAAECLSQHWLASCQVEARDGAAAWGVAENLRDDRLGNPALEQSGGHGAPQVVGAQAPVAGAPLPAADQRGDVAAAALHNALVDIGNRLAAIESSLRQALENRQQPIADRHPTQAALAAHAQQLAALVDVLEAKAGKLAAANAKMRERFEDIREALRGAARWRRDVGRSIARDPLGHSARWAGGATNAFDQIERLLPPEDVERRWPDLWPDDLFEGITPAPAVRRGDAEQPTEEA